MTLDPAQLPPRVRLDLAYVGTGFHGWQVQPDLRTVQGELASALARVLQRPVMPTGAGRTDTGVHAHGQVAHVELRDQVEVQRVTGAVAKLMPDDIQIHSARQVSPAFNARLKATSRRYSYRLRWSRNIFDPHAFEVGWRLDHGAMDAACRRFLGTHDCSSLCKADSLKDDNTCRLDLCALEWTPEGCIFRVRADRFLHHMVRNMVGLLLEIGRGRRQPDDVDRILAARSRSAAGMMAPAHGLYLDEVTYPAELDDPGHVPADYQPWPREADEGDPA